MALDTVLADIERQIADLEDVANVIRKKIGKGKKHSSGKKGKHKLSAEAREKIAAAQRARWAKVRKEKK